MTEKSTRDKILASTYLELHRYGQNGEYDKAFKAANRILHMAPLELPAFHCKVVCLIQQSKFDEALQFLSKYPTLSANLLFENAYCLYRLNKPDEALKMINEIPELNFKLKELKAQVLYRLEQYNNSQKIYEEIIKNSHDDYNDERETNLNAVITHLSKEEIEKHSGSSRENAYELCYNSACQLIAQNNFLEAEKRLKKCEKLWKDSLEEDGISEEEIEIELAFIRVQLGYVYQRQGRLKEAQQLYITSLKLKLDDIALVAVASNNIVVMNKDQNVFDSKKKMKAATNENLVHKLPSRQRRYIALNSAIFSYYSNQNEQCLKVCAIILQNWPDLSIYANIVSALCHLHMGDSNAAINILKSHRPIDENERLFLQLTCAHIFLMQGDRKAACDALENLGENRYKPGIVGALITLYLGMGKEETALKIFENTVDWYRKNKVKEGDLSSMWRQAADFHIRNGHPHVAANSLEELLASNPSDKKTIAQLVLALAQFDRIKAIKLGQQLTSIKELIKEIDLDSLESANWFAAKRAVTKADSSPSTPRSDSTVSKRRKHRKRKGKLPKNYDANATPDPERWLPKYERTGFRKKRDRRAKEVIKGSQGTTSVQADQYDFSKIVEQETPDKDSPISSVEPSPASKNQFKKSQQKKKNKRR